MTLGCRAFFLEFLAEFEKAKKKTNWMKIYEDNKIWTAKMLGTGPSREKGDYGLLGRIGQRFGYKIDPEWRHIDQVWFYNLPKPKGWQDPPWKNDVMIEHENDIDNLEYTLVKFDEVSVPLKVGIFYPGDDEEEYRDKAAEIIKKQVTSYPGEVYLIIFGFAEEDRGVHWHAYEIDFKGNIIQLHE